MMRRSIQLEIDEYIRRFLVGDFNNLTYTKQSFSEARQKLRPEAFEMLSDSIMKRFYRDDDYIKYKDFILFAIDGSRKEVPNNIETQKNFGFVTNGDKEFKLAEALSSNLYDVKNGLLVSSNLAGCKSSERDQALLIIDKMLALVPGNRNILILFDRGYPSLELIMKLNSRKLKFLMRVSSSFLREVNDAKTNDETVEIVIDRERATELRKTGISVKVGTIIKLRVIKVELKTGEIEILITNLEQDELSYDESKELYFMRWGIETKYDELKNKFEIENFSGWKSVVIKQDYYATIYLCNLASIIEQDAQEELRERNSDKNLKHEYKVNKNILIGKLKFNLIEILLEDDNEKRHLMYENLIAEIIRNVVPIRKNRSYPRKKKNTANRYCQTRRRAL